MKLGSILGGDLGIGIPPKIGYELRSCIVLR